MLQPVPEPVNHGTLYSALCKARYTHRQDIQHSPRLAAHAERHDREPCSLQSTRPKTCAMKGRANRRRGQIALQTDRFLASVGISSHVLKPPTTATHTLYKITSERGKSLYYLAGLKHVHTVLSSLHGYAARNKQPSEQDTHQLHTPLKNNHGCLQTLSLYEQANSLPFCILTR